MSKAYEQSGVNIHARYEAVERMSHHVKHTMRKEVISGLGGFGATFDLSQLNMTAPVFISWNEQDGSEIKTSYRLWKTSLDRYRCSCNAVNDILTTGTNHFYIYNYIATNKVSLKLLNKLLKVFMMHALKRILHL